MFVKGIMGNYRCIGKCGVGKFCDLLPRWQQ